MYTMNKLYIETFYENVHHPLFESFAFTEITDLHSIALQQRVIGGRLFKLELPDIPRNLTGIDILVCIFFDAVITHMI